MILILQAVIVMLATVVPTLGESIDLPPVPEDSEHMVTLEGSEPIPPPAVLHGFEPIATQELPLEVASRQPRYVKHTKASSLPRTVIRYVTKTETVTKTDIISPTVVYEERPQQTKDYCNSNGQFLFGPTNECYKYLNDKLRSFEDADAQCRKGGMRLAKPVNPKAIQQHLVTVLGSSGHVYIGARGDGQSFKWQKNGGAIGNTDPNWWPGMPTHFITTDRCLALVAQQNGLNIGKVYFPESCSVKLTALCQREECSPECTIGTCLSANTCAYDPRSDELQNAIDDALKNEESTESSASVKCTPTSGVPQSSLPWITVGRDRFTRFGEEKLMSWFDARALCQSHCLDLLQPKDLTAVAIYLDENYRFPDYWLGARGNGTHQVWLGGDVLTRQDPWHRDHYNNVATDRCLYAITHVGNPERGTFLAATSCTSTNIDILCG